MTSSSSGLSCPSQTHESLGEFKMGFKCNKRGVLWLFVLALFLGGSSLNLCILYSSCFWGAAEKISQWGSAGPNFSAAGEVAKSIGGQICGAVRTAGTHWDSHGRRVVLPPSRPSVPKHDEGQWGAWVMQALGATPNTSPMFSKFHSRVFSRSSSFWRVEFSTEAFPYGFQLTASLSFCANRTNHVPSTSNPIIC